MTDYIAQVTDNLEKIVINKFGVEYIPTVKIEYDLNSSCTLGTCSYDRDTEISTLRLNKYILDTLKEKYVDEIYVHEYEHAVVKKLYPNGRNDYKKVQSHGKEFKRVCRVFGIEGSATTNLLNENNIKLPKARKQQRVFYYSCGCVNYFHELTVRKHNTMLLSPNAYKCRRCRTTLKFTKEKGK